MEVIEVPMYYRSPKRLEYLKEMFLACEQACRNREAVILHCNQSFHRGPVFLATLAKLAGYDKWEIFRGLAAKRHIYPGHLMDPAEWKYHDPDMKKRQNSKHHESLNDAHAFVDW